MAPGSQVAPRGASACARRAARAGTAASPRDPAGAPAVRLGRVERVILEELRRRGGFAPRDAALRAAFPQLGPRPPAGPSPRERRAVTAWKARRAYAESAVSRAITSLRRKGLLAAGPRTHSGRTVLRVPASLGEPDWERVAREDEELAARCMELARTWRELALRARGRALAVRSEMAARRGDEEREADLRRIATLAREVPRPGGRRPSRPEGAEAGSSERGR